MARLGDRRRCFEPRLPNHAQYNAGNPAIRRILTLTIPPAHDGGSAQRDATIKSGRFINLILIGNCLGRNDMLGNVLDYSAGTGEGIISGDDGARYSFSAAEWRADGSAPAPGARVDFVGEAGVAYAIYPAAVNPGRSASGGLDDFFSRITAPGSGAIGDTVEPARRVLAFLVEIGIGLVVSIVVSAIVLPMAVRALALGLGAVLLWQFIGWVIAAAIMFAYYWFMYTRKGAGAGHLLIGARPVDFASGEGMSPQQATTRAAVAAAPWFFFGGGWMMGLWALFQLANGLLVIMNDDRRNVYDRLAGTRVVNARDRSNPSQQG